MDYSEDDGVSGIAEDGRAIDCGTPDQLPLPAAEAAGLMPDRKRVEQALEVLEKLAASYRIEKLYRDGALVAIAGRPNAGKSSLFNRLIREERSIVTDIPGTTRDYIEAWISLEGIPVRLVDTAGLRRAEDPIEQIGVERSKSIVQSADMILYLVDGSRGFEPEDFRLLDEYRRSELWQGREKAPLLAVWNKADVAPQVAPLPEIDRTRFPRVLPVSAKTGIGIPELAHAMKEALGGGAEATFHGGSQGKAAVGIASERQKALVDRAMEALKNALALADQRAPLDLIAPELREAVEALGEITGEVSTAEILETMFSRFCVGK